MTLNDQQRHILSQLLNGPQYRTEIPQPILAECIKAGWVFEDGSGFVSITHEGRRTLTK